MLNTPVLFAPFARPEYAKRTFNAIKKAKPKKLYFYSDKARLNIPIEVEGNNIVRDLVNQIDWDCELKTYFREEHVGNVFESIYSAFDWVFENEEQAILLEEDCVPSLAFFDFCEQLLPKYENDFRVWVISGNNFIEGYNPNNYDYFFSHFPYLWGWATWRSRWQKVFRDKLPYDQIKEYKLYNQIYVLPAAAKQALKYTRKIVDTPSWDYRFTISMKCHGGLGIIPRNNLVSNIGLVGANNEGIQTFFHNRKIVDYDKYIINKIPPFVVSDYGYSLKWFNTYYLRKKKPIFIIKKKIIRFISKILAK